MAPKRPISALRLMRGKPPVKRTRRRKASTESSEDDNADFVPASARSSSPRSTASRSRVDQSSGLAIEASSGERKFGVPSPDETFVSSSNGVCTRLPPSSTLPSLQHSALRSLSRGIKRLYLPESRGGGLRLGVESSLGRLPEHLRLLVWDALLSSGSGFIRLSTVLRHFIALPRVVLSAELPALHNLRTLGVVSFTAQTTTLVLTGLGLVTDASVADAVRKMPALEHVDLRGTTNVGQKTISALQIAAPYLRSLNLSETAVRLSFLQPLLVAARRLESLKLANLKAFNDVALNKLLDVLDDDADAELAAGSAGSPLVTLTTLKLRGNELSGASLDRLLCHLPRLERLDVSFNPSLRTLAIPPVVVGQLRKLHLTGTSLLPAAILQQLLEPPSLQLETLHLGALQTQNGWAPADVWALSEVCSRPSSTLRKLFLAGNPALTGAALSSTPSRPKVEAFTALLLGIAPFILHLDLALVPLRSDYLAPAFASPAVVPIREIVLDETGIDAGVSTALSGCTSLEVLRIKNSKVSLESLFTVLDRSPLLHTIDLTSCRSIPLRQRRGVFEAYDEELQDRQSLASRRR